MVDIDDKNEKQKGNWHINVNSRLALRETSRTSKSRSRRSRVPTDKNSIKNVQIPIQSLAHTLNLNVNWIRWDKTKHGWHVIIKVREKLTLAETIAAQAILGSDPARERLNLARCISLRKRPSEYWEARANILYSRKAER